MIHHFVEVLDRHFSNVCELDLVFNFYKAYWLLDEVFIAGARLAADCVGCLVTGSRLLWGGDCVATVQVASCLWMNRAQSVEHAEQCSASHHVQIDLR